VIYSPVLAREGLDEEGEAGSVANSVSMTSMSV